MTYTTKLTSKGQMTLTADVRKELGLNPGDSVRVDLSGQTVTITKDDYWHDLENLQQKVKKHMQKHNIEPLATEDIDDAIDAAKKEDRDAKEERSRS